MKIFGRNFIADYKEFRRILFILIAVLFIAMSISYVLDGLTKKNDSLQGSNLPKWAQDKPQNIDDIEDINIAMPYVTDHYLITYISSQDAYSVDYDPSLDFDYLETEVILWFKENTDFKSVKIKFGGVSTEFKTYDLTKQIEEILPDNEFMRKKDDAPYFTEETLE